MNELERDAKVDELPSEIAHSMEVLDSLKKLE